jgi:hypothetical protein
MAKRPPKKTAAAQPELPAQWRNRIIGYGEEDPQQLLANPKNFRIHPQAQQDALGAVLDVVGWVQHAAIVNQRTGFIVDGHLRVSLAVQRGEARIPVAYVDLSDAEESLVLASLDAISAAAVTDQDKLNELLGGIEVADAALDNLFAGMLEEASKTSLQDAADGDSEQPHRDGRTSIGKDKLQQIKPVIYTEDVATFERAIRATGLRNRGQAVVEICRFFLEKNGETTRQLDSSSEKVPTN